MSSGYFAHACALRIGVDWVDRSCLVWSDDRGEVCECERNMNVMDGNLCLFPQMHLAVH
jgi:hypothetical protein